MFFSRDDKETIQKILSVNSGNKEKLLHISMEVAEISKLVRNLQITIDQMQNDFMALQSRIRNVEDSLPIPPLKPEPVLKIAHPPTKKKK